MLKVIKGGVLSAEEAKQAQGDRDQKWRAETTGFTHLMEEHRTPSDFGPLTKIGLSMHANLQIECPHCHQVTLARGWLVNSITDNRSCPNCHLAHPSDGWDS